mmetsp:Transcript_86123/g.192554  ORF Transcript_86123/g.192554 Transcript_86123/m.192554 type:complete len:203 (-) Transcript_86123:797-1405(-)
MPMPTMVVGWMPVFSAMVMNAFSSARSSGGGVADSAAASFCCNHSDGVTCSECSGARYARMLSAKVCTSCLRFLASMAWNSSVSKFSTTLAARTAQMPFRRPPPVAAAAPVCSEGVCCCAASSSFISFSPSSRISVSSCVKSTSSSAGAASAAAGAASAATGLASSAAGAASAAASAASAPLRLGRAGLAGSRLSRWRLQLA